ncbi:DUF4233 domain-containing protein [Dactylosporangium roseum]|uniref:DUF4233 domain-containing protein n=1 Tax=Dactylosporangium roseum TaxID=47989 RepID=A0ABY5Z114_9ACTN|nr:DUF4233 domain-containing protein [Dactylosporangium roseum]UWZ35724.1 DUF4233 domain-containing protein [Dactylosporangium roseum]
MTTPAGLKNPGAAVRGVGAAALVVEGVVLLLALLPLAKLGHGDNTAAIWFCVALAVVSFALCGLLRHAWAWYAGLAVQVALLAGGALHWSFVALGVLFGLTWLYVLYVRRSVYANKPD